MALRQKREQEAPREEQNGQEGKKQVYYTRKYQCPNGGMIVLDVDFKEKKSQNGKPYDSWYAKVRKIYRDGDGNWQSTDFLNPDEMLVASAALLHGYEIVVSAKNQS